jgi:hypothetical protein
VTPSLTPSLSDLMSDPNNAALFSSPAPKVSLAPQPAGVPMLRNLIGDTTPTQDPGPIDSSGMGSSALPAMPGTLRPLVTNPRAEQEQRLQARIDSYDMPHPSQPGFWNKLGAIAGKVGNIIGNDFIPHTMAMIPGTDLFKQVQDANATQQLNTMRGEDQTLLNNNSKRALEGAQTSEAQERTSEMPAKNESELAYQAAQTDALDGPQYEVHDTAAGPLFVNKKTGMAQHLSADGLPVGPKVQTKTVPLQIGGKPHQVLVNDETGDVIKDMGESGEKAPVTNVNAGTWSVQTDTSGNPILLNSKTGETKPAPGNLARKPNAEEQKRADLAENVNENLNKLEDIVSRRPDLFGPVAGRMTGVKEAVGTSDPDVGALKTIQDNLGMAMQSAHGMRSASHVETSAQSVLNGFHNEPKALLASIKAARDSVGTFQNDVHNTNNAGKPNANAQPSGGMIRAYDDKGTLHEAPAGTALPKGWRLQ